MLSLNLGRPEKSKKTSRPPSRKRRLEEVEVEHFDLNLDEDSLNSYNKKSKINETDNTQAKNLTGSNKEADLFSNLYNNEVCIPFSWTKIKISYPENGEVVSYIKFIARKNSSGNIETVCQKEIVMDQNMNILIKFNGNVIDKNSLEIEDTTFDSIKKIEDLFNKVDQRQICRGCPEISRTAETNKLIKSFTYGDKADCLRHAKCNILLLIGNQNLCCKCCTSVKYLLQKKTIRKQFSNSKFLKPSDLSPERKLKMKSVLKTITASKNRTKDKINDLNSKIKKSQLEMNKISKNTLDELLNKQPNIKKNEK